jgi:hypothetical protein
LAPVWGHTWSVGCYCLEAVLPTQVPVGACSLLPTQVPVGAFSLLPTQVPVGAFSLLPMRVLAGPWLARWGSLLAVVGLHWFAPARSVSGDF